MQGLRAEPSWLPAGEVGDLDAVLLIRDADDQYTRKHGLEQARTADNSGCVIVIGVAVNERECWVITGFVAKDQRETEIALRGARLGSKRNLDLATVWSTSNGNVSDPDS